MKKVTYISEHISSVFGEKDITSDIIADYVFFPASDETIVFCKITCGIVTIPAADVVSIETV